MIRVFRLLVLALAFLPAACASRIAQAIVATRDHQGDVALAQRNLVQAARSYGLALKLDPTDPHARAGLADVKLKLAAQLFVSSKLEDALDALADAAKYDPQSARLAELRSEIEEARLKREIVVGNYPTYRETGLALRRSYGQLRLQSQAIVASLQRFDYAYDAADLTKALNASSLLRADVARLSNRLAAYRQLVEAGTPEGRSAAPLAPAASLLPLP